MKVTAKCHNYSGCLLAYRGEAIELDSGAPLVCPECGKPVTLSKAPGSKLMMAVIALLVIAVVGAGAYAVFSRKQKEEPTANTDTPAATPTPSSTYTPASTPTSTPATPTQYVRTSTPRPVATPLNGTTPASTPSVAAATPSRQAQPPEQIVATPIDFNPSKAENKSVKAEVLTRIDLMPNLSQQNKDKLYNSVERARSMGKLLIIPFPSGRTSLAANDVQALKAALEAPDVMKLRDDPTAVFVILGYADSKGDDKKNLAFSQQRADSVLETMRDKCGIQNVMHSVAMGSSTLLDAQNLEKNRIAEVWAVLP